ncbi:MAG: terminase small subunit [Lachnospiraceae bacterium]
MAKLTDKQQRFVEEYLIDLNATQAAIRAGYKVNNAKQIGSELLDKTRPFIESAIAERSRRTGITQDRVLNELAKIAFANAKDVVDFKTAAVREDASEEDLACIQSVKVKTQESAKGTLEERQVSLYDKKAALELLGKHLGLFKDKIEVSALTEEKTKLDDLITQLSGDG